MADTAKMNEKLGMLRQDITESYKISNAEAMFRRVTLNRILKLRREIMEAEQK